MKALIMDEILKSSGILNETKRNKVGTTYKYSKGTQAIPNESACVGVDPCVCVYASW